MRPVPSLSQSPVQACGIANGAAANISLEMESANMNMRPATRT